MSLTRVTVFQMRDGSRLITGMIDRDDDHAQHEATLRNMRRRRRWWQAPDQAILVPCGAAFVVSDAMPHLLRQQLATPPKPVLQEAQLGGAVPTKSDRSWFWITVIGFVWAVPLTIAIVLALHWPKQPVQAKPEPDVLPVMIDAPQSLEVK